MTAHAEKGGPSETETVHLKCMEEDHAKAEAGMKKVVCPLLDAEVLFL